VGRLAHERGGSDADDAWLWRDAIKVALVLQRRRLAPPIDRLEDAPAEIVALLASLSELGLTHSRRSEEQLALDPFSTPPQLAALERVRRKCERFRRSNAL
jgi:hypothetical protein